MSDETSPVEPVDEAPHLPPPIAGDRSGSLQPLAMNNVPLSTYALPPDKSPLLEHGYPAGMPDTYAKTRLSWWRRHAKWLCLVVALLIFGIVALILYLCLPRIAQGFMDGAEARFSSISVYAPRANAFRYVPIMPSG
jgi:hypothetical protein